MSQRKQRGNGRKERLASDEVIIEGTKIKMSGQRHLHLIAWVEIGKRRQTCHCTPKGAGWGRCGALMEWGKSRQRSAFYLFPGPAPLE